MVPEQGAEQLDEVIVVTDASPVLENALEGFDLLLVVSELLIADALQNIVDGLSVEGDAWEGIAEVDIVPEVVEVEDVSTYEVAMLDGRVDDNPPTV